MSFVPVRALLDVLLDLPRADVDECRETLRVELQRAGYPPDADSVSEIDALTILDRLDAGLISPVRDGDDEREAG